MKLIPAYGSPAMLSATENYIVRRIAGMMFDHLSDKNLFKRIAFFLKEHEGKHTPGFAIKLDALRHYKATRPDAKGNFVPTPHILDLVEALEALYSQPKEVVDFQRGAIVEVLAFKLVSSRCQIHECVSNHRFIYERNAHSTDQIDVAVLSKSRKQIEAYTCKIKSIGIASVDCTNLTDLASEAQEQNYDIHTGAICFDHSDKIEQRLRNFSITSINAYGVNNIEELQVNPFE